MPYSLRGRNVLITGGSRYDCLPILLLKSTTNSNRGLGALVAEKFASEGSNVAINYMSSKETADKVASDLAAKHNVKTIVIQGVCLFGSEWNSNDSNGDIAINRTPELKRTVSTPSR